MAEHSDEKLPLLRLLRPLFYFWRDWLTGDGWYKRIRRWWGVSEEQLVPASRRFLDRYIIVTTLLLVASLVLWDAIAFPVWASWAVTVLALWKLQEITGVTLYELVRRKEHQVVSGAVRWTVLTVMTILQIVLCFAVLFRMWGDLYEPAVACSTQAVYKSIVTLATIGYGNPTGGSNWAMWLIVWELTLFILVVVIRLPIAVSMAKVRESER